MVVGQEEVRAHASSSIAQQSSQNNDGHVSARNGQLQNQLNQVLLKLQNNQGNITQEPHTYSQAFKDPSWVEAMQKELKAHESITTWELTTLLAGFTQKEGIYYKEKFAHVAKMVSIRALLAGSIHKNWFIEQLDINNAVEF
ncbi:ribonuclease H-like domain-containing protein [Tanacetum coccineum]